MSMSTLMVNKYHLASYPVYINTGKWVLGKKITWTKAISSLFAPRESEFRHCTAGMWDAILCSSHETVSQSIRYTWVLQHARIHVCWSHFPQHHLQGCRAQQPQSKIIFQERIHYKWYYIMQCTSSSCSPDCCHCMKPWTTAHNSTCPSELTNIFFWKKWQELCLIT